MDGQRLRDLRKNKGYTQKKLSNMLNVDLSTIGKWEIHNVTPASDLLIKLANIFNVSVGYLLGADDPIDLDEQSEPQVAFSGGADDLTEDELAQVQDFIAYLKSKRK